MEPLDLRKIMMPFRSFILFTGLLLPLCSLLPAQTNLALSSATVPPGGVAALDLSLSSDPSNPLAALEWTFNYPPKCRKPDRDRRTRIICRRQNSVLQQWSKLLHLRRIGIERQYHFRWSSRYPVDNSRGRNCPAGHPE